MSLTTRVFIVNNIKLSYNASFKEAFSVAEQRLKKLNICKSDYSLSIYRKSIDARNKDNILTVYSVCVKGNLPCFSPEVLKKLDISENIDERAIGIEIGDAPLEHPPVIVGAGPCGLFCALLLAENGYKPTLIERGGSISERKEAVARFISSQILDTNTNIQFGAGGAGTFSDGKLVTRINDPISSYVLKRLVDFGAPNEILYLAKPHIGTDILAPVVNRIIDRITELGGEIHYHTRYIDTIHKKGISIAKTDKGSFPYSALVLAVGHSARDTYDTLISNGYSIEAKPFSVGMRIEHLSENIDYAMYGKCAGHPNLGHAEYNLSYNTKERGVYTFCMCPGGEVVAAASEEGGVVVNGMSAHARDGINSNSAVLCSIFKEDYGSTPKAAIQFQKNIEHLAYIAGGGNYSAPIITVGDFLNGECRKEPDIIKPTYMNGNKVKLASPSEYLPDFVCKAISTALLDFNKKINGFSAASAVLTGAETRTSAPIRILRNSETRTAVTHDKIYPAGEGAGYAGGITSAAIDGIKTALSIMKRYRPY